MAKIHKFPLHQHKNGENLRSIFNTNCMNFPEMMRQFFQTITSKIRFPFHSIHCGSVSCLFFEKSKVTK